MDIHSLGGVQYLLGGELISYKGCQFETETIQQDLLEDEEKLCDFLDKEIIARQTPEAVEEMKKQALKSYNEDKKDEIGDIRELRKGLGKTDSDTLYALWVQSGGEPPIGEVTISFDKETLMRDLNESVSKYSPCYAVIVGDEGVITMGMLTERLQTDLLYHFVKQETHNGFKAMYDLGYDTFKDTGIKRAYEIISSTYEEFAISDYNRSDRTEYECIRDYLDDKGFAQDTITLNASDGYYRAFKGFAETYNRYEKEGRDFTIDDISFKETTEKNNDIER